MGMGLYTLTQTKIKLILLPLPLFWTYLDLLSLYSLPLWLVAFFSSLFKSKRENLLRYLWLIDGIFFIGTVVADQLSLYPLIKTVTYAKAKRPGGLPPHLSRTSSIRKI